ncbi:unnamed protein product, partial [Sphagnum balticum]
MVLVTFYSGWSGGLGQMSTGQGTAVAGMTSSALFPNLDGGIAGYDATGQFTLVQTQEFTAELQYILPFETVMAVNLEYGRLKSNNVANLAAS